MRYRNTAVQVYDVPASTNPDAVRESRLALLVSMLVMLGLAGFAAFVVFGVVSQKL